MLIMSVGAIAESNLKCLKKEKVAFESQNITFKSILSSGTEIQVYDITGLF